ncbi:superoxide dismutase [Bacillus taeanensis]|uniref:superoxide dismutase n=1 Tax=Bacillus taeanensis TaxID=273032 RepID=A0A366XVT8_9BACI|nr:superoxide dismutase [Bacillus taeanensis]RBW69766.1 superoxide dismutase [Bacillus taeanensis]
MDEKRIKQYVDELKTWANLLHDKWLHFEGMNRDDLNEENEQFGEKIQQFINSLYTNTYDVLSVGELQENADSLYKEWRTLKNSHAFTSSRYNGPSNEPVPIGGHKLPPLPYAYNALEPYIDERIMRLHHDKHHQSYVDGLNKAEKEMEKARRNNDFDLIKHWEREAAFNGGGHYLHTIFWNVMTPKGGGEPKGELLQEIKRTFGSFQQFKKHFSEAAKKVEAVGWAILVWAPRSHRLEILQAEKHQNLSQWDVIPLLVLDVWEHAYYLQYENKRAEYVDNWWNVVNWPEVSERFKKAKELMWKAY